MQVFGPATSPMVTGIGVGTGASKYTDLVTQYANTLADGSKASLDDQLNAYTNLQSLLHTDVGFGSSGGLLAQTNMNDANRAGEALYNSSLYKNMQQAVGQYCGSSMPPLSVSGSGNFNDAQNQLATLTRFSADQQKMIFVGLEWNMSGAHSVGNQDISYASVDAWKAALKTQAAAFDAQQQQAASATASSATAATAQTLSAITAAAQTTATTTPKAAATLTPQIAAPTSGTSIALQVLISTQAKANAPAAFAGSAKRTAIYTTQNDRSSQTKAASPTGAQANSAQQTGRLNQLA